MKQFRVYADTSVFGGCFDDEFSDESRLFFADVKAGKFVLVISATAIREIERAPDYVQKVLAELPPENVEIIEFRDEIARLRDAYLEAQILEPESKADAEHIASASVADVDFVVSWNFKHIVHYEKINGYQAVNLMNGYREIRIYSPREVVRK
jgi:predicted nucleic acid-binding protein